MARHLRPDGNSGGSGGTDWPEMDWLEETPQPQTPARRQQPSQNAAPPRSGQTTSRPRQQAPARRQQSQQKEIDWQEETPQPARRPQQPRQGSAAPQSPAQQRPVQQRPAQQRPVQQQRPAQQQRGYYQQQPYQQQRPVRQQPAQDAWQQPARSSRYVAVDPDDYRPRRRRGSRTQNILLIVLVVVLVAGVLVAGGKLGSALLNYRRDRTAYNDLADEALSGLAEPNATTSPDQQVDPNAGQQTQSEAPFAVNWDYLRSVNSDVVGWIYCAGTQINYPVVQTFDNEFYLHRDFTSQQPNTSGTLFVDPNATLGVTYSNYIIYGHNMKDGSMFAAIEDYVAQSYYDEHPVMYYLTPTQNYRIDLIAGRIVESTLDNYPGYFSNDQEFSNYLNDITSHSFFGTHAGVNTGYQLVTMSTCDYSGNYNDPRFLLQGMLVPIQ